MAQINPNAYPTAYKISHADADGTTPLDIEFSYDLATLVIEGNISMDTIMDGSNSYGGFDASAHNYWVGGSIYGRAQGNPNDPAYGGVSWSSHQVENPKQNLRWFLKITSNASTPQGENPVRWTPQLDDDELTPTYNPDNEQSMVSAMTNNTIRLKEGGIYSLFYTMYPITKIDLDKIQLYPAFTVIRYAFTYNEDDIITGVTSTVTRYHWNDIKPEDNTAAGANYNADLWLYGFYDEMDSENPSHVKYRYVVDSCYVEQYYWSGKRSASGSGKLSAKINNSAWDFSGDAVLPSNTGYNNLYGYLVPLSEGVFSVGGVSGVMINPVSGLIFGGTATNMNKYISFDTSKTDSMYYRNVNGQGTTMIASPTTTGTGFTLKNDENDMTTASVIISQPYGWLFGAAISPDYDVPSHYELRDNGAILHINQSSGRNVIELVNAPFPIEKLWQALASLGVYIVGTSSIPSGNFTLGQDFPSWLYHGEVLEDGTTTGVMIQGEDIEDLPTWDTIDYEPVIPTPTPPGPGEENTGTDIRRPTGLGVGGTNGFITQYALTASQIAEIGRLLWLNFTDADYYKNFLFALTTTGSIDISNLMDYFVSLRVYPFPLINVPSWASAGQDMYIGAGVIPLHFSSTIHTINNYADYIDAGSCTVPRYFNDFRDFTHTQIMLFLPYCGTVQLNPADVIGGTLYAQYAIDFASGGVNAYVDLQTHDGRYFMIASLSGNIGADIPLTATNAAQIASKIAGDALNFAGTIGGAAAGDLGNRVGGAVSALTGNVLGVAGAAEGLVTQPIQGAVSIAQEGMRIATSDGVKIPMLSGGRGFGSFGQPQTAYIQIRRGIYVEGQTPPQGFKHAFGEAYDQPVQVGSCRGYTVFDNIDTSGLSCTDAERAAIVKQMQQGIFI